MCFAKRFIFWISSEVVEGILNLLNQAYWKSFNNPVIANVGKFGNCPLVILSKAILAIFESGSISNLDPESNGEVSGRACKRQRSLPAA